MHNGWRPLAGYPRNRADRRGGQPGASRPDPAAGPARARPARVAGAAGRAAVLDPQWEAHLSGVEFAVEEIPPLDEALSGARGPVPLSRLEPGSPRSAAAEPGDDSPDGPATPGADRPDSAAGQDPHRIVVYRRPLMARADDEDELGELVFDVVVEEFARMLGLDPGDVDPGYGGD